MSSVCHSNLVIPWTLFNFPSSKTDTWGNLYTSSTTGIFFLISLGKFFFWPLRGSNASRLEPLWGGSLLFTTKFPDISGTHFIDLGRMKGWVELGVTQDPWIENRKTGPLDWKSSATLSFESNLLLDLKIRYFVLVSTQIFPDLLWNPGVVTRILLCPLPLKLPQWSSLREACRLVIITILILCVKVSMPAHRFPSSDGLIL